MKHFIVLVLLVCCGGLYALEITDDPEEDVRTFINETRRALSNANSQNYYDMQMNTDEDTITFFTRVNGSVYTVTSPSSEYFSRSIRRVSIATTLLCDSTQAASIAYDHLFTGFTVNTGSAPSQKSPLESVWVEGRSVYTLSRQGNSIRMDFRFSRL
jgi:hypothetical protein